jgi:L-aminopeptidase/D-esterase-like protein
VAQPPTRCRARWSTPSSPIAVIATNATLTKAQATKVAQMADDGLARAIKPSHGVGDGDTIFVLATGTDGRDATNLVNTIGSTAADTLSRLPVPALRHRDVRGVLRLARGHGAHARPGFRT